MFEALPPGWLLLLGAVIVPLLPRRVAQGAMLLLPAFGLSELWTIDPRIAGFDASFLGPPLEIVRIDPLSRLWGTAFYLAAFLCALYSLHLRDPLQQVAALIYAGAAIGAVFAGDLLTLAMYWELVAVASAFLIWARRSERAYRAGMRTLLVQSASGCLLLVGTALYARKTGSIHFAALGELRGFEDPALLAIFAAFAIQAAFPLFHNWLGDACAEGTATSSVWLATFTAPLAIYALARGFPGEAALLPIGLAMAVLPALFAVIQNDLRRTLAYGLNSQLGFMVVGIGVGSASAINAAAAHAFAQILCQALFFMAMGAVLLRTGTSRASELGGLYKSMPWTCAFCLVAAASVAALPLTAGFAARSMLLAEASQSGLSLAFPLLLFAAAAAILHTSLALPYFAFFAPSSRGSSIATREAPPNMLVAMAITAALCTLLGVFPYRFYALLPSTPVVFEPYASAHIVHALQLMAGVALAFAAMLRSGLFPKPQRSTVIDFEWTYRRAQPAVTAWLVRASTWVYERAAELAFECIAYGVESAEAITRREAAMSRSGLGRAVPLWLGGIAAAALGAYLL